MIREQLTIVVILMSTVFVFTSAGVFAGEESSSDLSVKWGELTAPNFIKAVKLSLIHI